MAAPALPVTGEAEVDRLLVTDPWALLIGMLLDQQVPMEWAFRSPWTLKQRLGDNFTPAAMAAMDPEELVTVFCAKPALHRYPAAMARRVHELAVHLVDNYDGDAGKLWKGARDGDVLFSRIRALPGFGQEKAQIFLALLAKRLGKRPAGWEAAAGPFADEQPRSVADIGTREQFAEVRAWKQEKKRQGKSKRD